ncbi:cation:proton antiporter domain-containing protein [Geoalkalibacter halelectricus]|uniref:Cation:proton antiporter n=1 Tax=Geoalkalibacter halelectricus TaxID=2847045 RepID=A0ABY5ZPR5_9BACT|nr:cation:proton antiporter [Geoalkalibacter halelectricus]MDO3376928.1 cation:proton antiporter [Geoalkalibacter halelectricus]UWZ81152.1 cation:proton antiporter [Geoalkalibacter halelectricus]
MESLSHQDVTILLAGLGVLLAAARLLGEIARRFQLPAVFGEILAGILLGPTVLGALAPNFSNLLFPRSGTGALLLDGMVTLAIVLFLLVAGMEADISTVWRQGRAVATVGLAGIVFPFATGFAMAWYLPGLMGREPGAAPLIFALFIATALSISALPVIAKTLMDLDLYRSDLGMMIVAAAVFNDLIGWIIFAVILGMMGVTGSDAFSIGSTIILTLLFTLMMLTVARWSIHRMLPWIQAHASWPGGQLGFTLSVALLGAAFTEWIGVHAIFGSFLVGVAMGDTPHFRERIRGVIDQFVSFFFAPLFFASIGLKVNFVEHFDPLLVLVVLVVACLGKVLGCGLGGRLAGLSPRESWAIGFGMNARGAMEIILGLLALRFGLIGEPLFVALVIMAIVTSLMSGPAMQSILRLKKPRRFINFLPSRGLVRLQAHDRDAAIAELAGTLGPVEGISVETVVEAVRARERLMATGLGYGVAVPHARLAGLSEPVVVLGLSAAGIDFNAPDGKTAQFILLILTPEDDNGAQVQILADIARTFRQREFRQAALEVSGMTEFLALVKSTTDG